jgi:hypothetical protein
VLTARRTFSGAEEFTYNLQNRKRATVVGETTGAGAHPVAGHRIDDHFMIGVSFARAINPISKTNWEGVGVEPNVKVPATDALSTAQKLALEKLSLKCFPESLPFLRRYNSRRPFEPWLMRMTLNVCRGLGRKKTRNSGETVDPKILPSRSDPHRR